MNKKYKIGMTLSQAMQVIAIIGILIAITMPILTKNTHNQEYVARFKRTYSELDEATRAIMANNQGSLANALGTSADTMRDAYANYLNYVKKCNASSTGCWYTGTTSWHDLNGNNGWQDYKSFSQLVLKDGTFVAFKLDSSSCTWWNYGGSECGLIWFDTNGTSMPNVMGRDLFEFTLKISDLHPDSDSPPWPLCSSTGGSYAGIGCGARIMQEGDMNY